MGDFCLTCTQNDPTMAETFSQPLTMTAAAVLHLVVSGGGWPRTFRFYWDFRVSPTFVGGKMAARVWINSTGSMILRT